MTTWLLVGVLVPAGLTLVGVLVELVRGEAAGDRIYAGVALTELALVVQAVVGCVLLAATTRDVPGVLFVSYLVGNALVLPIGALWSLAERTRAGTGVLAVALLTVAALEVRLDAIWAG